MNDLQLPGVPPETSGAIASFRQELISAAGSNLLALVLYGGLARGRFRPGQSDVNVAIVLRAVTVNELAAIAPVLRRAWRELKLVPFILVQSELKHAADAFPTKMLEIQRHHVLLTGEDPFSSLNVSRENVRMRVEQELRNMHMRLRRRFITVSDDPTGLLLALQQVTVPLRVSLASLLELAGQELPAEETSAAVFEKGARSFQLDSPSLARLAALRRGGELPEDLADFFGRIMTAIQQATEVAHRMEGKL